MAELIYQADPYCTEFDARVVDTLGEWIVLDRTAFFPGGGGQDSDRGWLGDVAVTDVKRQEDGVVAHRASGHNAAMGDQVRGRVDWTRRYDLMKGHTGEHLLFSCLSAACPGLELVKISITPERKSLLVNGPLEWDMVAEAGRKAMEVIIADLPVTERTVSRDDPTLADARVKLERIHGDMVRVVDIGDVDRAACAGIHVASTGEIGMILVASLTSARPSADREVVFMVGNDARRRALEMAYSSLRAAEALGSTPSDVLGALTNLQRERDRMTAALRSYGSKALSELTPSDIHGVKLYSGLFEGLDKKIVTDAATRMVRERAACVLGVVGERFMMIVACHPDVGIDCTKVIDEALRPLGGRGGGKPSFATGGAPSGQDGERAMVLAIAAISDEISALSKE